MFAIYRDGGLSTFGILSMEMNGALIMIGRAMSMRIVMNGKVTRTLSGCGGITRRITARGGIM